LRKYWFVVDGVEMKSEHSGKFVLKQERAACNGVSYDIFSADRLAQRAPNSQLSPE